MFLTILGVLGIVAILLIARPITTFFHELGHAIPALLFTRGPVGMYIGSYGDTSKSTILKFGRLIILFRYKITEWQLGLCTHQSGAKIWQELLIVLGGPLVSLVLGISCYYLILQYSDHSFLTLALATLLVSGVLDFLANIIPSSDPVELNDGGLILNDGAQLKYLMKISAYPKSYFDAMALLKEDRNAEGIEKLKETIDQGIRDIGIHRLVMQLLVDTPKEALAFNDQYFKNFKLQSADLKNLADLYFKTGEPSFAIQCYSEAIHQNYQNKGALVGRAKAYIYVGLEEKALEDLKIARLIEENKEVEALIREIGS